jgi:RNA polymerase sigma factor (sigma-70 family)
VKKKRPNEVVVREAKAGSKEAIRELWENNIGMFTAAVQRTVNLRFRDDAMQECYLMMLEVVESYDPAHESGAKFATYLYRGLRLKLMRWVRKQKLIYHSKKDLEFTNVGLKTAYDPMFGMSHDIVEFIEREEIEYKAEQVRSVMKRMKVRERLILNRRGEGASLRTIGKEIGISSEGTRQAFDKAKAKLLRRIEKRSKKRLALTA